MNRSPHRVVLNVLECEIEFELRQRYYVYFQTNTFGKGINPIIFPAINYVSFVFFCLIAN